LTNNNNSSISLLSTCFLKPYKVDCSELRGEQWCGPLSNNAKKASHKGDYCLNIIIELLKCRFQMEIAVTIILRRPSEYTQRKQSIDMTGCKAVIT